MCHRDIGTCSVHPETGSVNAFVKQGVSGEPATDPWVLGAYSGAPESRPEEPGTGPPKGSDASLFDAFSTLLIPKGRARAETSELQGPGPVPGFLAPVL